MKTEARQTVLGGGARKRPVCIEEVAAVEMLRTVDMISRPVSQLLKGADLSGAQYNVLRILRGAPEGLTCTEIGNRMVSRDPDITRLLDRMEKRGHIRRWREECDRRVVMVKITEAGLETLAQLDDPIHDLHRQLLGHLGRTRIELLISLLAEIREGQN